MPNLDLKYVKRLFRSSAVSCLSGCLGGEGIYERRFASENALLILCLHYGEPRYCKGHRCGHAKVLISEMVLHIFDTPKSTLFSI